MSAGKNEMNEQSVKPEINGTKQMVPADGFPYGVMRCTFEKYPKVIAVNHRMLQMLHVEETSEEWQDFIQENIFFMVPIEMRLNFREDLRQAAEHEEPVQVEHRFSTGSGGTVKLIGWIWVTVNEFGTKEYALSYMPMPADCISQQKSRESAYQQALESVYDGVFRIDRCKKIAECIYVKNDLQMLAIAGTSTILNDTLREQFYSFIQEEDRAEVEQFLADVFSDAVQIGEKRELEFRVTSTGRQRTFRGVRVELDEQYMLFCCQEITRERYAEQIVEEMETIRSINREIDQEGAKQPVRIDTYRVMGERVILRSDTNIDGKTCEMTLDAFLKAFKISREEYQQALREGKTVLHGTDHHLGRIQQLYSVRTPDSDGRETGILLFLYTFKERKLENLQGRPRVYIHTFGYFDVLVDGKPVLFRYEKSKEMLAILVDRKGSFVANPYFISCLWENEPYSEKIQNRCRQTAYRMMETLKQYGIEDIIEKVDGRRRIVPERVDCDFFHYIQGDQFNGHPFAGAYMSDYSWGEETLSRLLKSETMRER